jgi:hypothetical protein
MVEKFEKKFLGTWWVKGSTEAPLHGGSNETIGGFGRHRRPEIV